MKRPPSRGSVEKMRERERNVGLEPGDAGARWLEENAPEEVQQTPRSARKSKLLHQWRQAQQKHER